MDGSLRRISTRSADFRRRRGGGGSYNGLFLSIAHWLLLGGVEREIEREERAISVAKCYANQVLRGRGGGGREWTVETPPSGESISLKDVLHSSRFGSESFFSWVDWQLRAFQGITRGPQSGLCPLP